MLSKYTYKYVFTTYKENKEDIKNITKSTLKNILKSIAKKILKIAYNL